MTTLNELFDIQHDAGAENVTPFVLVYEIFYSKLVKAAPLKQTSWYERAVVRAVKEYSLLFAKEGLDLSSPSFIEDAFIVNLVYQRAGRN